MRKALAILPAAALALGLQPAAAADPASTFGLFSRSAALAGADAATAGPTAAPLANPAAAGPGQHVSLTVAYLYSHSMLTLDGADAGVPDAHGFTLGLRVPLMHVDVASHRLQVSLAMGLHVPDRWLARIYLVDPSRPTFTMWEGQVHRIMANPVLALALDDVFAVGAGATLLADGAGTARLSLGYEGAQTRTDAQLDLRLRLRAAPVLGVMVHPTRFITLAAGWSGELALDMELDVAADLNAPGLEGDTLIVLRGTSDYTPHTIWAALSVHPAPYLDVHVRWAWVMWSRATASFARMRMVLDLGGDPSLLTSVAPEDGLRDAWVLSLGLEGRLPLPHRWSLALRGGYQYRPTPAPASGRAMYADSDVHLVSTGIGLATSPLRPVKLTLGWALQVQRLVSRSISTVPDAFPPGSVQIEGWVVATMLDATLDF